VVYLSGQLANHAVPRSVARLAAVHAVLNDAQFVRHVHYIVEDHVGQVDAVALEAGIQFQRRSLLWRIFLYQVRRRLQSDTRQTDRRTDASINCRKSSLTSTVKELIISVPYFPENNIYVMFRFYINTHVFVVDVVADLLFCMVPAIYVKTYIPNFEKITRNKYFFQKL